MSIRMFITYPHLMDVTFNDSLVSDMLFFLDGFVYLMSPVIVKATGSTDGLLWTAVGMCAASVVGMGLVRQGEGVGYWVGRMRSEGQGERCTRHAWERRGKGG